MGIIIWKYPCKQCGKQIVAENISKRKCDDCIRENIQAKNERWRNRNYGYYLRYNYYYNMFLRLGTGWLGPELTKDKDGNPLFEAEQKKVENEIRRLITNPVSHEQLLRDKYYSDMKGLDK